MPSRIQELLAGRDELIDYSQVVNKYPWLLEKNQNCVLSPDSDGLLCGLLTSHFLNWKVCGFYDGKVLVMKDGMKASDCVFLDMEIFRSDVRSVGQHMLLYNKHRELSNWSNFKNCASINNLRQHDGYHDFRLKYPFATVHFLIGVLGTKMKIDIPQSAISPLLFTDGTWMNLLGYTENSLSWLSYLRADEKDTPLNNIFLNQHYSLHELMLAMNDFLRKRDAISISRERGDRVAITIRGGSGTPHNLVKRKGLYDLSGDAKERAEQFLHLLSDLTRWEYKPGDWTWDGWHLYQFTKRDFTSSNKRLNNRTFEELVNENPLSFAMTSSQNIEFTLEQPDKLP